MAPVRQLARQKARGRPAEMTDPSSVDLARRLATAKATGVAQRRHLILWGSVTCGVTWWRSDPYPYGVNGIVSVDGC